MLIYLSEYGIIIMFICLIVSSLDSMFQKLIFVFSRFKKVILQSNSHSLNFDWQLHLFLIDRLTYFWLTGAIAIVAGAGGQFVGGLIVFKSELSVRGILKLCVIISLLALAFFFIFLFRCPDVCKYLFMD